jgi:hypothetical protein
MKTYIIIIVELGYAYYLACASGTILAASLHEAIMVAARENAMIFLTIVDILFASNFLNA